MIPGAKDVELHTLAARKKKCPFFQNQSHFWIKSYKVCNCIARNQNNTHSPHAHVTQYLNNYYVKWVYTKSSPDWFQLVGWLLCRRSKCNGWLHSIDHTWPTLGGIATKDGLDCSLVILSHIQPVWRSTSSFFACLWRSAWMKLWLRAFFYENSSKKLGMEVVLPPTKSRRMIVRKLYKVVQFSTPVWIIANVWKYQETR